MAGKAAVRLGLPSRDRGEDVPPRENVFPGPRKHVHFRHDADLPHVRTLCNTVHCCVEYCVQNIKKLKNYKKLHNFHFLLRKLGNSARCTSSLIGQCTCDDYSWLLVEYKHLHYICTCSHAYCKHCKVYGQQGNNIVQFVVKGTIAQANANGC